MENLGDFFSQPFVQRILLFLIVIGGLYIGLVVFIFRRAAKRRKAKEQARLEAAGAAPSTTVISYGVSKPRTQAVPASGTYDLPEPDFHLLVADDTADTAAATQDQLVSNAVPMPTTPYNDPVESFALIPAQEAAMTNTQNDSQKPASVDMGDAVEVMRVWRDLSDGSLIIEMGNQRYRSIAEIKSPDLVRRFTAIVRELASLVSNTRTTGEIPAAPPASMGIIKAQAESMPRPSVLGNLGRQGKPPSISSEPPSGIANAVEEFLQFKLSTTSQFARRSIHIKPSPNQGIIIEVDGNRYEAISDVEDLEVRDFLSSMMEEWSARH
jgi:hypothetical protein